MATVELNKEDAALFLYCIQSSFHAWPGPERIQELEVLFAKLQDAGLITDETQEIADVKYHAVHEHRDANYQVNN